MSDRVSRFIGFLIGAILLAIFLPLIWLTVLIIGKKAISFWSFVLNAIFR